MASPVEAHHDLKSDVVPDLMNDPAYATNARKSEKGPEDPDTCRICRGEGTEDEALFYPCKCSGSIKFVHQDCLMEWLSHSHKKHCELCKTPFRFTKLYHPHMPETIPTTVFLHRAAIHCMRQFLTWCRGFLVVSVWLLWLPWCMRFVWRGLFWIGDGGWARDLAAISPINSTASREYQNLTEVIAEMMRDYNISTTMTAAANSSSATNILPTFISSSISRILNHPSIEPVRNYLIKRAILERGLQIAAFSNRLGAYSHANQTNATSFHSMTDRLSTNSTTSFHTTADRLTAQMQPSLLSGISLFNSLTPSPSINRLILDILEGQVITFLVLVAFILIFLIREWVVQQQPVINMAALNAQNARREPQQHAEVGGDPQAQDDVQHGNEPPVPPNSETASEVHAETEQEGGTSAAASPVGSSEHSKENDNFPNIRERHASGHEPLASELDATERREHVTTSESRQTSPDARLNTSALTSVPPELLTAIRESRNDDAQAIFDSLPPEIRAETSRRLREASSSPRPQMPSRDQSSIATAVMREMEEIGGTRSSGNASERFSRKDDVSGEDLSENSSESWQHLSGSEDEKHIVPASQEGALEHDGRAPSTSTSSKGKARVTDTRGEAEDDIGASRAGDRDPPGDTQANASDDGESQDAGPATNPFHPDYRGDLPEDENNIPGLAPTENPDVRPDAQQDQTTNGNGGHTWLDRLLDWLWGDAAPAEIGPQAAGQDVEEVLEEGNNAQHENFVHVIDGQPNPHVHDHDDDGAQDPEVLAAAQQAGIDPDPAAVDDAEDLEGIMELIGMQGPLTGLIQNAMFGAFLISATVAGAVWFPYLWGKLVIMFVGSPISLLLRLPIAILSGTTDFVADICLFFGGSLINWGMKATRILFVALGWMVPVFASDYEVFNSLATFGRSVGEHAFDRIANLFVSAGLSFDSDYLHVSLKSHAALRGMQNELRDILSFFLTAVVTFCRSLADVGAFETFRKGLLHIPELSLRLADGAIAWSRETMRSSFALLQALVGTAPQESAIVQEQLDPSLAYWSATDRLLAVLAGYGFFAVVGALYLRRGAYFTTSQQGRKVEGMITEILQQAGGVMKVIFIISIEMIVFPLYCGILLDVALLPLCEDATVFSRVDWTLQSPWTSGFVHWFIGTCYMFHFALFVSMCRKIMRNGVLYFIRDPDDPTFHPVRDVLERNVSTQLRKITFSALVYGGLVIVCLGGVVWSLTYCFENVLPIRWSANEPFFEFPIDLLLYHFLAPLLFKALQPSLALHTMYEWWFRRCARALRLSQFFFGERHADEEGHHIHTSWTSFFTQKRNLITAATDDDVKTDADESQSDVRFVRDGHYVRAPASDQVRIPKGRDVFLEVDENNQRLDGQPDEGDGMHGSKNEQFEKVYIPPWFRVRIGLFIGCLWVFAAVTGIGLTIVPLLFGRKFFSMCLEDATRINDIYAFCFGLYSLAALGYCVLKTRATFSAIRRHLKESNLLSSETIQKIRSSAIRSAKVIYTYSAFAILVPCIFALGLELYFILPLHSYVQLAHHAATANNRAPFLSANGSTALNTSASLPTSPNIFDGRHFTQSVSPVAPNAPPVIAPHVLHILQSWTLGLLYFRLTLRVLLALPAARAGRALRAVVRRGWWDPDVALATRGFVLPLLVIAALIVAGPPVAAGACVKIWTWLDRWSRWFGVDRAASSSSSSSTTVAGASATPLRVLDAAASAVMDDEDAVALLYRFSYPIALATGMGVWGAWGAVKALARWRRVIRDEVYLVGERLHNFGEVRAAGLGTGGRSESGGGHGHENTAGAAAAADGEQPRPGVEIPRAPPVDA